MTRRPAISSPCTPVSSPCIDVCAMQPKTGFCTGCGRTLDEIARWAAMDEPQRRAIMATLPARIEALGADADAPGEARAKIASVLKG